MSGLVMPNGSPAKVHKSEGVEAPKFEDLTPAQQEALADKANELGLGNEGHPVTTAYLVVIDRDGSVAIIPDLTMKFDVDRQPTAEDILGSAAVVQSTIAAQVTASATQQIMLAQARAMAQQQQQAQDAQRMQGLNLRS